MPPTKEKPAIEIIDQGEIDEISEDLWTDPFDPRDDDLSDLDDFPPELVTHDPEATAPEPVAQAAPDESGDKLARIFAATAKVTARARSMDLAKDEADEAKDRHKSEVKLWEMAVREQQDVIAECQSPTSPGPLFDAASKSAEQVDESGAADDESWRSVRLYSLDGLAPKILKALSAADIDTVGAVGDFTKSGARLTEIEGIGPAAAEKIEEALVAFWGARSPAMTIDPDDLFPAPEIERQGPPAAPGGESWRRITIKAVVHGKKGADAIVATLAADEYPIRCLGDLVDAMDPGRTNFDNVLTACGLAMEQVEVLADGLERLRREHGGAIAATFTDEVLGLEPAAPPAPTPPKPAGKKKTKAPTDLVRPSA